MKKHRPFAETQKIFVVKLHNDQINRFVLNAYLSNTILIKKNLIKKKNKKMFQLEKYFNFFFLLFYGFTDVKRGK